ncbi:hypothetical protein B0H14DRAFT_2556191 [Mycena olivaceomarginata]|nr:hypothetical protein B0H14DRAFT_2556191 [Mycena olivaceomarginata]
MGNQTGKNPSDSDFMSDAPVSPQHLPKLHTDGLVPFSPLENIPEDTTSSSKEAASSIFGLLVFRRLRARRLALIPTPAAVGALGVVAASVAVTGGRALRQSHISVDWKLTKLALWNSNRSISLTTGTPGSNNATPSSPPPISDSSFI